ncbi:MAG: polyprenyl synthetase family protein [Eubacterium sp.]|nr:polyprenyl synthetase family protein [Eubacterium sp.]
MTGIELIEKTDEYTRMINEALLASLPVAVDGQQEVVRAMRYSIENGGKRIRPILVLEFCRICGGDIEKALPFACAVEFVHTYSLIHDDLPCMDDDDLRRGKPSCHIKFKESTALLAGDALLTHAFECLANAELDEGIIASAVMLLAQNAGVNGMIGGQVLDLKFETEDPSIRELVTVHKLKTGALISAACLLGCIAAGADSEKLAAASGFAYNLGVAFQIKDDILDVIGDEEVLGKPTGSDEDNNKNTYVSMVGIDKAELDVETLTEKAVKCLNEFEDNGFLTAFANQLMNRIK